MPIEKTASAPENIHDLLIHKSSELDVFFAPNNVALIGATETRGSVGRTILQNLISSPFGGTVFPVNPKRPNVLGVKAYPKIGDIPAQVDLAIVVTPAPSVPAIVKDCTQAGVKGCIVISAGFKETGPAGLELETQILEEARRGRMRVIGPNCLGVMNPLNGFNGTFAKTMALPGNVGFISQSGALLTAILDWSLKDKVGFSSFVSIGSMLDVGWGDLIDYLGDDPRTKCIVIYMETIGDARSFMSAAREVALSKPIIVIKPGRTAGAAKAAASHTGSMTGSDEVLDAAFRRCGVLRVDRIDDLFNMAEVLGKQPRPKGNRLTIITNAGGPGVLATDALIQLGGELAPVAKDTMAKLDQVLPAAWSHNNPIDVLGDAAPERYAKALEIAGQDPTSDGLLVILTPQAMTDATGIALALKPFAQHPTKPVIASWMGGSAVEEGIEALREASIPDFPYPDMAVRAFTLMCHYSDSLRALYETPSPAAIAEEGSDRIQKSRTIIAGVQSAGRVLLTETESKDLLAAYGIPVVPTRVAASEADAVRIANEMGYPVVLKLFSETITHKTDVGGVELNLKASADVENAFRRIQTSVAEKAGASAFQGVTVQPMASLKDSYELIIGSTIDSQFGPVLLFGGGGQLVEVYKDSALGLPPLNTTLARRLMERTRIYKALKGVRGRKAVDLKALEQCLVRFSYLVVDNPRIKEIDINPLIASGDGLLALDARVVLHEAKIPDAELPASAIRPYPIRYVGKATLKNGMKVTIRPIRHQDEPLMIQFHKTLSEQTVYQRYFANLQLDQRVTHDRLLRRCFIDYRREMALVAEAKTDSGANELLGVARLVKHHRLPEGQFALLISDPYQKQGLGHILMERLLGVARDEKLERLVAEILPDNAAMIHMCEKLGFKLTPEKDGKVLAASLPLI